MEDDRRALKDYLYQNLFPPFTKVPSRPSLDSLYLYLPTTESRRWAPFKQSSSVSPPHSPPSSSKSHHLTSLSSIHSSVNLPDTYLRHPSHLITDSTSLADLAANNGHPVTLDVCPRLRGGKGGFGSQLRAAGREDEWEG